MEIRVWRFQNYRDCGYTCNPHKFAIPALRFPSRVPVNPYKHLQCTNKQTSKKTNKIKKPTHCVYGYLQLFATHCEFSFLSFVISAQNVCLDLSSHTFKHGPRTPDKVFFNNIPNIWVNNFVASSLKSCVI